MTAAALVSLLAPFALHAAPQAPARAATPAVQPPAGGAAAAPQDSIAARRRARRERSQRVPRRIPVTPALEASAFAAPEARTLLQRARAARLSQDSALAAYDARTYQRLSAGMGVRAFSRERLLLRAEHAARVTWSRGRGVTVQPTGSRAVFPAFMKSEVDGDVDLGGATPIPYFPGRESLWLPSSAFGVAKAEVDDREFVHPLAVGSEAYYRYSPGGTASIRLPDGRVIALRELRVAPRRPAWRLFVGSFWFDANTGQLVRAAYRMSVDMDIWQVAGEDARRDVEEALARARTDTSAAARAAVADARREADDDPPGWVKGMLSPLTASIGAVTVEYGLYGGRFWLPRRNVAEGSARAGFMRFPFSFEERYRYDQVDGGTPLAGAPAAAPAPADGPGAPDAARVGTAATAGPPRTAVDSALALAAADSADDSGAEVSVSVNIGGGRTRVNGSADLGTAARAARIDSTLRALTREAGDLARRADSLRTRGDTTAARRAERAARYARVRAVRLARREQACRGGATSYDAGTQERYDGALPVRVRRPCDETSLATSPDLPASPFEPGEQLFGEAERDQLLASLDFGLQPAWAPQPPVLRSGLAFVRFNRVEGPSLGGSATSALGRGYTAAATARLGVADLIPNAELALSRTDGRSTVRLGAFHRLAVANDDWGNPLSFGASAAAALYGRDEGFYYRAWGLELGGTRPAPLGGVGGRNPLRGATLGWRLFAERQRGAAVEVRRGVFGPGYVPNVAADRAVTLGASGDLGRTFGVDPAGLRTTARLRGEGGWARFDGGAAAPAPSARSTWATTPSRRSAPYARGMAEVTLLRPVGALSASVTGAAGAAAGPRVPVQRLFYVGGLQTVRGQFARPAGDGYAGTAFWLTRSELGLDRTAVRPTVFYDVGWAGPRDRLASPGRPLSGAGVGLSALDGLVRADLSRGIAPERRWRLDLSLDARF
jgi:hypothetical protein